MKKKDAVLIATATAAGLYWYAQSRKPKVLFDFTTGIAAGVKYMVTAFGEKTEGTKLFADTTETVITKGAVKFRIVSNGTDDILFEVIKNGKPVYDTHAVLFDNSVSGMTCNATYAL